jgi:hypothetical protein
MRIFYMIFGGAVLALYAATGVAGWEPFTVSERVVVPAEVRRSPGGYRSYHFWYSGTHWGK